MHEIRSFDKKVGVHQGSVLSPHLFAVVMRSQKISEKMS